MLPISGGELAVHDLRALVVDDSKVGRLTMCKKLEAIGVKVDMTESGQLALDYLEHHRPDLIFMDYMMPDMDGFEVTRRIKASPATRDIPVIIVSGSDDEAFVEQALALGAINVITKPPADGVLETILGALPKAAAEPPASAAVEPAPVPSMDRAEVHVLVEQLLAGARDHLHDSLMADVGKRVEAEFERQRKSQQELSERWREQLDQTAANMGELRRGAMDVKTLGEQLNAIEQRLLPLESKVGRPQLDLDALLANMDQRIASGLADLQARSERQEALWEGQRQALLARLGDQSAQVEQRIGGLGSRLDGLSADVGPLLGEAQSAKAVLEQRFSALDQRLRVIEAAEASPVLDEVALLAAVDDRISTRLAATTSSTQLPKGALHASEEQVAQPLAGTGDNPLRAEIDQLNAKVRTLTLSIALGSAVLLAAIAILFLR
jgi:CheY-like chemotaxis protein